MRSSWQLGLFVALAGCAKPGAESAQRGEPHDFWGFRIEAPTGASYEQQDSVLPGPGGLGGSPVGERPTATIAKAGADGFYVNVVSTKGPTTLDAMKASLEANEIGSHFDGKPNARGWELHYDMVIAGSDRVSRAHVIAVDGATRQAQCSWADVNCPSPTKAEAVCRAIQPR